MFSATKTKATPTMSFVTFQMPLPIACPKMAFRKPHIPLPKHTNAASKISIESEG